MQKSPSPPLSTRHDKRLFDGWRDARQRAASKPPVHAVVIAPEVVPDRVHRRAERMISDWELRAKRRELQSYVARGRRTLRPYERATGRVAVRPHRCWHQTRISLNRDNGRRCGRPQLNRAKAVSPINP